VNVIRRIKKTLTVGDGGNDIIVGIIIFYSLTMQKRVQKFKLSVNAVGLISWGIIK